ncbi:hypothetical protein HaLaN_16651, partial [Haematococcus lacustris]
MEPSFLNRHLNRTLSAHSDAPAPCTVVCDHSTWIPAAGKKQLCMLIEPGMDDATACASRCGALQSSTSC